MKTALDRVNSVMEDRAMVLEGYPSDLRPDLRTMMLSYNRYGEAELIIASLGAMGVCVNRLSVTDFGAGVGDHGLVFLRRGCVANFVDTKQSSLNFIQYRCDREKLSPMFDPNFEADLTIYSKILEHLEDPATQLLATRGRYIYTSSWPIMDDIAKGDAEVLKSMRDNFAEINLGRKRRLWVRA